jgi:hypothetical protein
MRPRKGNEAMRENSNQTTTEPFEALLNRYLTWLKAWNAQQSNLQPTESVIGHRVGNTPTYPLRAHGEVRQNARTGGESAHPNGNGTAIGGCV